MSNTSSVSQSKKRVVIVGGGVGGAVVAKNLEDHAEVFLIEGRDFFEVPYAGLRCIVQPSFAERACIFHKEYLKKCTLVTNNGRTALKTEVVTDRGEHIKFDFLVIATGSQCKAPLTRAGRLEEFVKENQKLQNAKSILIVGGGPVGVELAGEVVTDFPSIKVTLVHAGNRLLDFIDPAASKKALDWLKSRNVQIILNDKVESFQSSPYHTVKGLTIQADAYFLCVGKKLGSSWLAKSYFEDALDENGRVKVDKNLRLVGHTNVFAVGDVTNLREMKQGYFADLHAHVVVDNIKTLIKDPQNKQLQKYKTQKYIIAIVSLGRDSAICQTPCCICSGKIPAAIKCNDLFVTKTRNGLGLK